MPVSSIHPTDAPNAARLAQAVEEFLAAHPQAAIVEDGRLLFDLHLARYSISTEHGRCLLHLWSEERNLVRTVTAVEPRRDTLRLETRRFGQTRAQTLAVVPGPDCRTPTARDTARRRYARSLEQALAIAFPGWSVESFRTAADLENSFGPAYARGVLTRGRAAWAVIGVGPEEPAAVIDGVLTLGILWLAHCREHGGGRHVFHGLRVVVPRGCAAVSLGRMAWLSAALAQWELCEMDPAGRELTPCAIADTGNLAVQLAQAFDPHAALERCATGVAHLRAVLPPELAAASEVRARSATEIAFSLHGLEYARVRHGLVPGSFTHQDEITFGAGPGETRLDDTTEDMFLDLLDRVLRARRPTGSGRNPLYRLQPERWLESVLRRDLSVLHAGLGGAPVYSQVPAFASASRTLLDLLTATRQGRLAVLELKADDDLHLPLQALDYWARVRMLHRADELRRRGYFPGMELSEEDPLLVLVAPALHIHPANETVLRHLAPKVPWELIALDEHWRQQCRVVLRRRREGRPC